MEVRAKELNSANIRYDNGGEETRKFEIEANAQINRKVVTNIESGVVLENGIQLATFTMYGDSLNPSFQAMESMKMCEVLMGINEFIASVKEKVSATDFNV